MQECTVVKKQHNAPPGESQGRPLIFCCPCPVSCSDASYYPNSNYFLPEMRRNGVAFRLIYGTCT